MRSLSKYTQENDMLRIIFLGILAGLVSLDASAMGERYDDRKTVLSEEPPKKADLDIKAGGIEKDDGTSRIKKSDRFDEDKIDRDQNVLPRPMPSDLGEKN